jgi:phospholipase C
MNGFVRAAKGAAQPMGYYTLQLLPFTYGLANTFAVANRWFCSAPCQTYPNRRFLMAGTAYGEIETRFPDPLTTKAPPNRTIFDLLTKYDISWRDYYTDVPTAMIIPSIYEKHPDKLRPLSEFVDACKAGTLPNVSLVDPGLGLVTDVGRFLAEHPYTKQLGVDVEMIGGSEEAPQDMAFGERWAYDIVRHITRSPCWSRTLLIYTYDEHGGYYDHVEPEHAVPPDDIPPDLAPTDTPGSYDIYGPRVPAIIVSPYSRRHSVSNTVYDHTSVLATIEAKWNLPALTYRDARANPVWDLLDFTDPAFLKPPPLKRPPGMWLEAILDLLGIPHKVGERRPRTTTTSVQPRSLSGPAPDSQP